MGSHAPQYLTANISKVVYSAPRLSLEPPQFVAVWDPNGHSRYLHPNWHHENVTEVGSAGPSGHRHALRLRTIMIVQAQLPESGDYENSIYDGRFTFMASVIPTKRLYSGRNSEIYSSVIA